MEIFEDVRFFKAFQSCYELLAGKRGLSREVRSAWRSVADLARHIDVCEDVAFRCGTGRLSTSRSPPLEPSIAEKFLQLARVIDATDRTQPTTEPRMGV